MNDRILIVDDDAEQRSALEAMLAQLGYASSSVTSAQEAIEHVLHTGCATVLADLDAQQGLDVAWCARLLEAAPHAAIVVVTKNSSLESAVEAMRAGAFDYLMKPIDVTLLGLSLARATRHVRLRSELQRLREAPKQAVDSVGTLLGTSPGARRIRSMIERLAVSEASVLIQGETGTGKELIARAIHAASPRAHGPFVAINCASMPFSLLESELFGHAKGAFTDAKFQRAGLFVEASGGTLFLDEIGEMPLAMQSKLLRALQERVVRPVGSAVEVPFDARIFSATHRNLEDDVEAGRFRRDLLYRINVVSLEVPPLRARSGDTLRLASHFLAKFSAEGSRPAVSLSPVVAERLLAYDWPGNVRELENCMERIAAVALFDQSCVSDLPEAVRGWQGGSPEGTQVNGEPIVSMHDLERDHILHVLGKLQGNKSRASQALGLDRRTLYRKLDQYRRTGLHLPAGLSEQPQLA